MEEVWEDICLSTTTNRTAILHEYPTIPNRANTTNSSSAAHGSLQGMLSQEFLTSSSPSPPTSRRRHHHRRHSCFEVADGHIVGFQSHPHLGRHNPDSAAGTILSLNSLRPEEYHPPWISKKPVMSSNHYHPQNDVNGLDSSVTTVEFSILPEKRVNDIFDKSSSLCGRKNKRMMKNRESAARSRARKQAYTSELEDKVTRLVMENATLRRQLEKLCLAANAQFPKRHTLSRSLTAPF